jgi:hypothetical protein
MPAIKTTKTTAPAQTAQLKITLRHTKPVIWRRVLVPHDIKLSKLHHVIQDAMGDWDNSHLHSFFDGEDYYQPIFKDSLFGGDDDDCKNEAKYHLSDVLPAEGAQLLYTYDFGDNWEHDIILEKLIPAATRLTRAEVIAGQNACPPEDCGGAPGYRGLLKTINNPKHPEYEDLREWFGLDEGDIYDPVAYDLAAANNELRRLKV